jgi:hypothetical protein
MSSSSLVYKRRSCFNTTKRNRERKRERDREREERKEEGGAKERLQIKISNAVM